MSDRSRREFLKKLARGSVYAAPVVSTLLAPRSAGARVQMGGSGMGMDGGMAGGMAGAQQRHLPDAPWFKPPPDGKGGKGG